jgi:hypothetical protein
MCTENMQDFIVGPRCRASFMRGLRPLGVNEDESSICVNHVGLVTSEGLVSA